MVWIRALAAKRLHLVYCYTRHLYCRYHALGTSVRRVRFSDADYQRFSRRLQQNLETLEQLLKAPGFGVGPVTLGAELEIALVGASGESRWLNQHLQRLAKDPQLTLELNRYNLEYNLSPVAAAGRPFSAIAREMVEKLDFLDRLGAGCHTRTATIGILPTLTHRDIALAAMTPDPRYQALTNSLRRLRGSAFNIDIDGNEALVMNTNNLNVEGANTSFQIHLRVAPAAFADHYNAAQCAIAPVLALCTNSPSFLSHELWEETRVVLFKQAVDARSLQQKHQGLVSRTGLGRGWVESSALELFRQAVEDYPVLLPECADDPEVAAGTANSAPALSELRLHGGSIWPWNRAIYDPAEGGHLRVEMRALPAGPTPVDMAANAALLVGVVTALSARMGAWTELLPFQVMEANFYRAARYGLDAELYWPDPDNEGLRHLPVVKIIECLLPLADAGLSSLGVEAEERQELLGIIAARLASGQTGARWQQRKTRQLQSQMGRQQAMQQMLLRYMELSRSGTPVHAWPLD